MLKHVLLLALFPQIHFGYCPSSGVMNLVTLALTPVTHDFIWTLAF